MMITVDLDRFFDFLTRFSLILRFQPILPLQNSRGPKTVIFRLFAVFSTLGTDCEGNFELTFDFLPEHLAKHKRLTTFDAQQTCFWPFLRLFKEPSRKQWHIYTRKICKKDDFLNFSAFWTLGNDCEGDFGLAFDFHTEELVKYKQKTAFDAF